MNEHSHDHGCEECSSKKEVAVLIAGAAIFAAGFAISYFTNLCKYIALGLFIASYLLTGGEIVLRAAKNILHGKVFDEHFLMSIATIGAFAIGEYPEAVAVMLFYRVGELFQNMAVRSSRKSIAALMDIRPDYANISRNGEIVKIDPVAADIGDIIIVKPGEKIPLDGIVTDGISMVDTSALTGEPVPRKASASDPVLSGCVNLSGVLTIEVTKTYGESTVAKIIDLVENAAHKKAKTENFITRFARVYTPAVVGLAMLIALVPPLAGGGAWVDWINRALVFLVISCPCALVISIPLGFFGGIGGASRRGILVKGGNYLEALADLDIVAFDKTGTLTQGVFIVTKVLPSEGFSAEGLLEYAALAETYSNHPIAAAIRAAAGNMESGSETPGDWASGNAVSGSSASDHAASGNSASISMESGGAAPLLSGYQEIAGYGVSVLTGGNAILAGNRKLMKRSGVPCPKYTEAGTVVYVSVGGVFAGHIIIADEIKQDSFNAIIDLKARGVGTTVMLTGDNQPSAQSVAEALGIDEVYSDLLPGQKVEIIELLDSLKRPGGKLAFLGDGINDAPVLARADIGVAMGALGSDAAIEAADVVLMSDEPSKLAEAIDVARFTKRVVLQNIVFALAVKGAFLLLGALGVAAMWEAVFADVGVALLAVANATRVMRSR